MAELNVIKHLTRPEFFGSQTKLAEVVGCKPHTICEKQTAKNPLTYQQMVLILERAPEFGVTVTPDDFFPDLKSAAA